VAQRRRIVHVLAAAAVALAAPLGADSWPAPRPTTVWNDDGTRFVRIEPGSSLGETVGFAGAAKGAHARGLFYRRQPDRSYRLVADVELANPVAPVDLLLSRSGHLVTFDNWHNVGYGDVVAIYDPQGRRVAAWKLEQLYPREALEKISQSVSSRWWRCPPFHFVDPDEQTRVTVREALGGSFVFELATGSFSYEPGTAACGNAQRD
jgi:hypothetical protein